MAIFLVFHAMLILEGVFFVFFFFVFLLLNVESSRSFLFCDGIYPIMNQIRVSTFVLCFLVSMPRTHRFVMTTIQMLFMDLIVAQYFELMNMILSHLILSTK